MGEGGRGECGRGERGEEVKGGKGEREGVKFHVRVSYYYSQTMVYSFKVQCPTRCTCTCSVLTTHESQLL